MIWAARAGAFWDGHRVRVTRPGADESEDAYAADNEPCRVSLEEDRLTVTGAEHPFLKTDRGLKIKVPDETSFEVTSFVTNTGPMLYSGGVWAPTFLLPQPGQEFGILLGDRRLSWDLVRIVIPRKFAGHTAPVDDPQVHFSEDFMIVLPGGIETKRMLMAPMGIAAMTWPEKNVLSSSVRSSIHAANILWIATWQSITLLEISCLKWNPSARTDPDPWQHDGIERTLDADRSKP